MTTHNKRLICAIKIVLASLIHIKTLIFKNIICIYPKKYNIPIICTKNIKSISSVLVSSSVTSRARRSTFGTTPSDRRCDTNGRHPQPEVSQLSPFLSHNRKDRVRLTPREQPPSSRTLRSKNPRTHKSQFGLSEFTNVGKLFCVESYRPNALRFELPVSASEPAISITFSNGDAT